MNLEQAISQISSFKYTARLATCCLLLSIVQCIPRNSLSADIRQGLFRQVINSAETTVEEGRARSYGKPYEPTLRDVEKIALLIVEDGERAYREQDDSDLTWTNLAEGEKRQFWHVSPMKSLPPYGEMFVTKLLMQFRQCRNGQEREPTSTMIPKQLQGHDNSTAAASTIT